MTMLIAPRVNPIVRAIAEDALTFATSGEDPRAYLRRVAERLVMAGEDRIVERFVIALRDAEALIGQCPARRRHVPCATYFVQTRPQQVFCSPGCQSRFNTLLSRARAER